MTREDAIEWIEGLRDGWDDITNVTACNMAIEALEQEPCNDAISRQAVIELVEGWWIGHTKEDDLATEIKSLPSVTPQPKMGRWISCDILQEFKCSECRRCFRNKTNFCPNCGARMKDGD